MSHYQDWYQGDFNTLKASYWELFKAKLLGYKIVTEDADNIITSYIYNGKIYITDYNEK